MSEFFVWREADDGALTYVGVITGRDAADAAEGASGFVDSPGRFHVVQCEAAQVFDVVSQESFEATEWNPPEVVSGEGEGELDKD